MEQHRCIQDNARLFLTWIRDRGGVAIWHGLDLGNPCMSWSGPALGVDGTPSRRPHWSAAEAPARIITNASEIVVDIPAEHRRFRVATRHGSGMRIELTPASTRKVHKAVDKAGEGAWYAFDYDNQEAVIYVPDKSLALDEWDRLNPEVAHVA